MTGQDLIDESLIDYVVKTICEVDDEDLIDYIVEAICEVYDPEVPVTLRE